MAERREAAATGSRAGAIAVAVACGLALGLLLFAASGPARAEKPAAGSPLYDPLETPLSTEYSFAPLVPALNEFKQALLALGYNFQVNYTGEVLGNSSGGAQQGPIYEGLLELGLDGDLDRIAGWKGGSFHVNAFQIHGHGLSTFNLYNFLTVSGIEAVPTTRLFEAWFQQELFGGLASIRVGQLAAGIDFLLSEFDALYFNATFGWPNLTSNDLPGTGPNYPLATPGIQIAMTPNDQTRLLVGLFNGDPAGSGLDTDLAQIDNCCGINFRLQDPPFLIGEAQFEYVLPPWAESLRGKVRIGNWHHFGEFPDTFFATDGRPLADPSSNGVPAVHIGNHGTYGIIDQMIWQMPGDDPWKGIGVFALALAAPADRNLISVHVEGGINFMGIWDARPHDLFGAAFAYTRVSPHASARQQLEAAFSGSFVPIQSYEIAFEATYQAEIAQGLIVQPDFQYIFRPGAGAINPLNPSAGLMGDAAVFGLRTVMKF